MRKICRKYPKLFMKKTILVFVFSIFFLNAYSQDVLETVAKEVCSCVTAKSEQMKNLPAEKFQMELGLCIVSSYSSHEKDLTAKYGDVLGGEGVMEKLGRDIGFKMVTVCPDIMMSMVDDDIPELEEAKASELQGQVVEIKSEQFLNVVIKDASGRTHSLIMLTFFEGANLLIESKIKKNDKVSVEYWEQEFYDVKAKDFRYYKVVQSIKKI